MATPLVFLSLSILLLHEVTMITSSLSSEQPGGSKHDSIFRKRSDDAPILGLQTLVHQQSAVIQQQAAAIQTLQARVAALENKASSLESQATKQVAFSASFSEDTHPLPIGSNAPIPFSHVTTNLGGAYDAHTGIFTAPTSGLYALFLTVREDSASRSYVGVGIKNSQDDLCRTIVEGTQFGSWDKGSCFVTTHLHEGDQVHAQKLFGDDTIDKGWQTAFSGVLISADL